MEGGPRAIGMVQESASLDTWEVPGLLSSVDHDPAWTPGRFLGSRALWAVAQGHLQGGSSSCLVPERLTDPEREPWP